MSLFVRLISYIAGQRRSIGVSISTHLIHDPRNKSKVIFIDNRTECVHLILQCNIIFFLKNMIFYFFHHSEHDHNILNAAPKKYLTVK